jgi:hypothetical protein
MENDRRISQRDRDTFAARARREFWARKQADAAQDTGGPLIGAGWYRVAYLGNPVGTW